MNFQVTVLKILGELSRWIRHYGGPQARYGNPCDERTGVGRADQAAEDAVPYLDIFSQALVERVNGGWRITDEGRAVLALMEAKPAEMEVRSEAPQAEPSPTSSTPRLLASSWYARTDRRQRRRAARERARA